MRILSALLLAIFLYTQNSLFAAPLTKNWDSPFSEAIARLKLGYWQSPPIETKDFKKITDTMWTALKKKQSDWQPLLNFSLNLDLLMTMRKTFEALPYIAKVYQTKAGTLIFSMKDYPDVLVKIDNRPAKEFDDAIRSYYSAFQNTQSVQKNADINEFNHLFLTPEIGRDSKEAGVKVVFSEKIPLFSEAELDQQILLNLMLRKAATDSVLKKRLETSFKQAISYICKTDFDDINFRNMPFTIDGRLAPFDTDSFLAESGVHTFIQTFFAYKILPKELAIGTIKNTCKGIYALQPNNIEQLYDNKLDLDNKFDSETVALNQIIDFLSSKDSNNNNNVDFSDLNIEYSKNLENIINKQMNSPGNRTLLAQRCSHILDLVSEGCDEIIKASNQTLNWGQARVKVKQILEAARTGWKIYAPGPIDQLGRSRTSRLGDYICF